MSEVEQNKRTEECRKLSMIKDFPCPVCNSVEWEAVETFCYDKQNHTNTHVDKMSRRLYKLRKIARVVFRAAPQTKPISYPFLNFYDRGQQEVLFNVWFPRQDTVTLKSQYCRICGFACYTPRPTEEDSKAFYAYIRSKNKQKKKPNRNKLPTLQDTKRAQRIYTLTSQYVRKTKLSVLDYGGGNGQMLLPFMDAKHDCYLVDYMNFQIPGIRKIADDLASMSTDRLYDIVICSHVLEHMTDPVALLKGLKEHLSDDGIIYAEVPLELRCGFPIESNPITHCNFFAPASLHNLFDQAGYRVISFQKKISNYYQSEGVMMWLIAQSIQGERSNMSQTLPPDTKTYLYPSRWTSIYLLLRLTLWSQIRVKFRSVFAALNPAKK